MTQPIPKGFTSVTPILIFKDSLKAIEFYKLAFGAQQRFVSPGPNGQGVMHAEILIGNSIVMMSDEFPQQQCKSAETLGGSPASFFIYLENVDAAFSQAVAAGAKVQMAVQDMFWGDRAGSLQDPFGYNWMLATHTKDLTPQEIEEAARAAFAGMPNTSCPAAD